MLTDSFLIATENPYRAPPDMPQVELQIVPVTPDMGPTPAEDEQRRKGFDERVYSEIITPEKTPYVH